MKVVPYAVAILLVTSACGSSSAAARPSPSHSPSPSVPASATPGSSPAASPSASPQASPIPPITGAYGVLVTHGSTDTYTVSIIGVDGKVVASSTPSSPTQMTCGDAAAAVLPPPVSTSGTRVYFLDAQGNVNFLAPNGETGQATHVPTGGNVRSMFAVSPDDQRIAVVDNTYTSTGANTVLYVEDLNGGGNHVKLFSETGAYTLWPIGWHGTNNLVVAKVPSCTQGGGPLCCGPLELHVVDPSNGYRRFTVGSSTCVIAGAATPAGVMCENTSFSSATVVNWTGASVRSFPIQGPVGAFLSPDGTAVALVDSGAGTTTFTGVKQTMNLLACGWIDATHVFSGGDTQQQALIGDVTTGNLVPIAAQGTCGGTLPGGL